MELFVHQYGAFLHLGVIFSLTLALMLVVYALSASSNRPAGLGLYTVYFMASLLGWLALTIQHVTATPMVIDVPTVAAIINSYLLFLAASQRGGTHRGRWLMGAICLGSCLSVFFLPAQSMFTLQCAAIMVFFGGTTLLGLYRAIQEHNVGDGILAYACAMLVFGMPAALYQQLVNADYTSAQNIAFAVNSGAYILIIISFMASVLIEYQQHLSRLATEDPLTKLLNRRGLEDVLQLSLAHANRHQLDTSAIMVDIDHFRQVNESFGHEVGNGVIYSVAKILKKLSRNSDVVGRIGGKKYLLILPETSLEKAGILAERIRLAIGEHPLLVDEQRIPITVSLGMACSKGEVDLDHLSQQADRALQLAKSSGRNRLATLNNEPILLSNNDIENNTASSACKKRSANINPTQRGV